MHFNEKELERIEQNLKEHEPLNCPICDSTDWTTMPYPGAIVAQQESTVNIFETLQLVQHVCDNCGYVVQFAASKVGVEHKKDGKED